MIHFDFIVDDVDAENIFSCITDKRIHIAELAAVETDPATQRALHAHACYLDELAAKLTNTYTTTTTEKTMAKLSLEEKKIKQLEHDLKQANEEKAKLKQHVDGMARSLRYPQREAALKKLCKYYDLTSMRTYLTKYLLEPDQDETDTKVKDGVLADIEYVIDRFDEAKRVRGELEKAQQRINDLTRPSFPYPYVRTSY